MRHTAGFICSAIIASTLAAPSASAQNILGEMLRGGLEGIASQSREGKARADQVRRQAIDRLRANPDGFCTESATDATQMWANYIGQGDFYPAAKALVGRDKAEAPTTNGYDAMLQGLRQENARRANAARQGQSAAKPPSVSQSKIKATSFDESRYTLTCSARADVDELIAGYVTWHVGVGIASQNDAAQVINPGQGWFIRQVLGPENTLEFAKANPTSINLTYGGKDLSWDEGVAEVERQRIALAREQAEREKEAAYKNSPAGRAEVARKRAAWQAEEAIRQRQELPRRRACEANGGTWGWPDASRQYLDRPSCFFQTVRN